MSRVWTVAEANAELARVTAVVERVRAVAAAARARADTLVRVARRNGHAPKGDEAEAFQAAVDELAAEGIVLRDADRGLVDFPAETAAGRTYWLCWVVGEPAVEWWHWPEDGFAGRQPVSRLPE